MAKLAPRPNITKKYLTPLNSNKTITVNLKGFIHMKRTEPGDLYIFKQQLQSLTGKGKFYN